MVVFGNKTPLGKPAIRLMANELCQHPDGLIQLGPNFLRRWLFPDIA